MIRELVGRTIIFEGNMLIALIFALLSISILSIWIKKGRKSGNLWLDNSLSVLRIFSIFIICVFFLRPVMIQKFDVKTVKPVALLIDHSGSMVHKSSEKHTRMENVSRIMNKNSTRLISHERDLFFEMFKFNHILEPINIGDLSSVKPQGETDYNSSLQTLLSRKNEYSGVIVVTDNATEKKTILEKKAFINRDIPLYWVSTEWSAGKHKQSDIYIKSFEQKNHFLLDEENSLNVKIGRTGIQSEFDLNLFENGISIFEKNIRFSGKDEIEEKIVFKTSKLGENWYQIKIKPKGTDYCSQNNSRNFYKQVIKSRLSILFLASPTDLDFKFIKGAVEKNRLAKIHFLPNTLKKRKLNIKNTPNLKILKTFPDKAFMEKIDLVILGLSSDMDLSKKDLLILEGYLNSGKGGFFVFPQDDSFTNRKDLEKFIPFQKGKFVSKTSRVKISKLGVYHPVMRLSSSIKINELTWKNFPAINGYFEYSNLKGGAIPLLVNDLSINAGEETGFIIYFKSGISDILFINARNIWKWAFSVLSYRESSEEFDLFINNVISFLGKLKKFENVRLELRNNYILLRNDLIKKPVKCTLKILDKQLAIVNNPEIKAILYRLDDSSAKAIEVGNVEFKLQQPGIYSSNISIENSGRYFIKAKVGFESEKHEKVVRFSVDTPIDEYNIFEENSNFMDKLVKDSGGKKIALKDFNKIFDVVNCAFDVKKESTTNELFSNLFLWVLLIMILFIDWSLRKRYGL
ncbi:hypothetical protein KAJ27_16880 [bacterium]|nr:hypothetical protein [bacterium]